MACFPFAGAKTERERELNKGQKKNSEPYPGGERTSLSYPASLKVNKILFIVVFKKRVREGFLMV